MEQAAEAAAANEEPVAEETAAEQPVAAAAVAGQAPSWRSAIEAAEEVTMVGPPVTPAPAPAPGEDTAPLEPMVQAEPPRQLGALSWPPRRSSGLARADGGDRGGGGGAGCQRSGDHTAPRSSRPSRAAPPRPAPAPGPTPGAGPCASVLVVGRADTATQLVATPLGAYVLRALDGNGHALLLLAERAPPPRTWSDLGARRGSARDWSRSCRRPLRRAHRPAVRADLSLRDRIAATTEAIGGRIVAHWQGWGAPIVARCWWPRRRHRT